MGIEAKCSGTSRSKNSPEDSQSSTRPATLPANICSTCNRDFFSFSGRRVSVLSADSPIDCAKFIVVLLCSTSVCQNALQQRLLPYPQNLYQKSRLSCVLYFPLACNAK